MPDNKICNKNALDFFKDMASNNPCKKDVKITKCSDFTDRDAAFILQYSGSDTRILDLASGSGLIVNKICDKVGHVTAVEAFSEFSKFIERNEKTTVINDDICHFQTEEIFDLVTMFGIVQYFNREETEALYRKFARNVAKGGKLIVKNQFGVKEDVVVCGYSEELDKDYCSEYRFIDNELKLLEKIGFEKVEVVDIYPPECNRWDNTHFYAIVASK